MDTCEYEYCKELPYYICKCEGRETRLCESHLKVHGLNQCSHEIMPNFVSLSYDQKTIIQVLCSQGIEKLKLTRAKIIETSNMSISTITSLMVKDLDYIREKQTIFTEAIEFIERNEKIVKFKKPSRTDQLIFKVLSKENNYFNELQQAEDDMLEVLDFEKTINRLHEKIETYSKGHEEKLDIISKYMGVPAFNDLANDYYDSETSEFIFYPENGSKIIRCIDPLNIKDKKVILEIPDNLRYYGGTCMISKNELFYNLQKNTYIIDLEKQIGIKKSFSVQPRDHVGPACLLNKVIYCFEDQNCEKYEILTDTWRPISPLPVNSKYNMCTGVISYIYLAGRNLGYILKFNISSNSYSAFGNFSNGKDKILLREFFKMYIIEEGKLYENINTDFTEFRVVKSGINFPNQRILGYPIKKGNYFYFVLIDDFIYRFNLQLKIIEKVREISF